MRAVYGDNMTTERLMRQDSPGSAHDVINCWQQRHSDQNCWYNVRQTTSTDYLTDHADLHWNLAYDFL